MCIIFLCQTKDQNTINYLINIITINLQNLQKKIISSRSMFPSPSQITNKSNQPASSSTIPVPYRTSNPYQLLKTMNKIINDQKKQIQQYQLAFQSLQRQKEIQNGERKKLQATIVELVKKIQIMKGQKNNQNIIVPNQISRVNFYNSNNSNNMLSPITMKKYQSVNLKMIDKIDYKSGVFQSRDSLAYNTNITKRIQESLSTDQQLYIPQPIRLNHNYKSQPSTLSILHSATQTHIKKQHKYAQNLLQNFLIIGPDLTQFKKKRVSQKGKQQITVKPGSLHCHSKFYKQNKAQFLTEIANRAFPQGCKLRKKILQHNQQLLDIIEYKPNRIVSKDYFVFTLCGDSSILKQSNKNQGIKKTFLHLANPYCFLFVICMKLPDFIHVRDQKNYHRKQNQVWIGQKIYAVATYYPFFNIHTETLCKIHSIMSKIMIRKILIDNQNILSWNITKSVYEVQKNQEINENLSYFLNKKPDYNQVCYYASYYFGTLPQFGFKLQYAISFYSCPIFFSNFSYQQMLLMLTAVLCQKTLIFLSKSQAMATLSALFLTNLILPFQYSEPALLLNCDSQRVKQMIFQFPFPIICSIKKSDQNIQEILELFVQSNFMRLMENDAQYVVIDVDSNTILYHHALDQLFNQCVVDPGKHIRQAYTAVNSCQSKSFSLPKQLPRQNIKPSLKQKSQLQKRFQQKKKQVKQYQQKIQTNTTKLITYRRKPQHENLLKLLTEYIQEFTLDHVDDSEIVNRLEMSNKNNRNQIIKAYLLQKFKNSRQSVLDKLVQSQMYANYLDSILKGK